MLNLIKIDLYKLFRSTSFYVVGIILMAIAAITAFAESSTAINSYTYYLEHLNGEYPVTMMSSSIFYTLSDNMGLVSFYSCIFAILFICSDFSTGTIKNIASKGFSREIIYISKLISGIISTIIYFVLTMFVSLIIPFFIVGEKIPHYYTLPTKFFTNFTFTILCTFAIISMAVFIASLIRKSGASIGTHIGLSFIETAIFPTLSYFLQNKFNWKDFLLVRYTTNGILREASNISHEIVNIPGATHTYETLKISSNVLTRWICVISICFVVFTALGIYLFKKRDI